MTYHQHNTESRQPLEPCPVTANDCQQTWNMKQAATPTTATQAQPKTTASPSSWQFSEIPAFRLPDARETRARKGSACSQVVCVDGHATCPWVELVCFSPLVPVAMAQGKISTQTKGGIAFKIMCYHLFFKKKITSTSQHVRVNNACNVRPLC